MQNNNLKEGKMKRGDLVRIINQVQGHGFRLGEEVVIMKKMKDEGYMVRSMDTGETWGVVKEEIELLTVSK